MITPTVRMIRAPSRHPLRCLLAVTLSLVLATAVSALPLRDYHQNPGDTLDMFVSGSSAQDNALERLFRLQCAPNTLDIYRAGGNQRVFFCRLKRRQGDDVLGVPNVPNGQKIAFHKSSLGGSGYGVGPVVQQTVLQFINMADLKRNEETRCDSTKRRRLRSEPPFDGYTEHQCTNPNPLSAVPDAGVSDVEPRIFANNFGFRDDLLQQLTVRSANAFVFGIPVSLNFRNALQAAQFDPESPCHPENAEYGSSVGDSEIINAESETCMPGLRRSQIAGIFAGTLTDWRQIVNPQGYPLAALDSSSGEIQTPPKVVAPSDTRAYICRRVDTSGTQASYEMYFLNRRCAANVDPFVTASSTTSLGTGTSNVKLCLNDRHKKNLWAIGIFSTENVPALDTDHWRFIKMDRTAPTLINTFNGEWTFFVEQTIQWRNERSESPLSGIKLTVMEHIAKQAGNPEIIRSLNQGFRHSFGAGGVMALHTNGHRPPLPTPGQPVTAAVVDALPVLPLTRASLGFPNNCNPPLSVFPTSTP